MRRSALSAVRRRRRKRLATAAVAFSVAVAAVAAVQGPTAARVLPGVPDVYLSLPIISVTERDGPTSVTVTATLREASAEAINVTLALGSAPLLTPGVRAATPGSDYTTTLDEANKRISIAAGSVTGTTTFVIDPTYDTDVEGDEAVVVTGNTHSGGGFASVVAPTDLIITDGPYLSFPEYIVGSLHYPGESISVTVDQAVNKSAADATVSYSLSRTEPSGNPLGLRFDPATRQLTGDAPAAASVPAAGLTTRYTITARDSAGLSATTMVSVAVVNDVCSSTKTSWFHATNEPPAELVKDCNVLLAARDTLLGTSSSFWLNWATTRQIETWTGLTEFHNTKQIRKIEVRNRYLRGTVPPLLGHLSAASALDLVLGDDWRTQSALGNKLTGPIPPELSLPPNLNVLALGGNDLSGPVPRELADNERLLYLYLHNAGLSGPIPPELGDIHLRALNLFGNPGVTGHIPWQLGKNVPEPQPRIPGHTQFGFQVLRLDGNGLTGTIPHQLGRFGKIQTLGLNNNALTGSIPWQLGNLGRNEATLQRRLVNLYLNDNQLTGPIPPQLGDIANLRTLSLSQNQLSGHIPAELGNLPKLWYLFLRDNQLRGGIPTELGNLAALRWLSLYNNPLGGTIPAELGNLGTLTHLQLSNNDLHGEIPASFGALSNLQVLQVACNDLSGSVPSALINSVSLRYLDIAGNQRLDRNVAEIFGLTVTRSGECEPEEPAATTTPTPDIADWSATLTVQDLGGGKLGCDNSIADNSKKCLWRLTADRFIIGTWRSYSVTAVYIEGNHIHFNLSRRSPVLRDYLLSVDNYELAFSYPSTVNSWGPWEPRGSVASMPFRWQQGSRVELSFNAKELTDAEQTDESAPATPATPLRVLSVSPASITEGQQTSAGVGTVTVTARLARPAAVERRIDLTPYGTATKVSDYNWGSITIAAGERTGTTQIWISDDAEAEGSEYIIVRARSLPPEAFPSPGAAAYTLVDPRITIIDNDTPAPSASAAEPNVFHSDPATADLARRIAACAKAIKTEVDAWLGGTGSEQAVRTAQNNAAACQFD